MAGRDVHLELLIGRRVLARDGRSIGRLEEVRAEAQGTDLVVTEYHVGSYAVLERLSAWSIGRTLLRFFGATGQRSDYRIPWDKLDLSDPRHPRLLCEVRDLAVLERQDPSLLT
jgi:sporulation protein YlmC with PRC-barrel domain